MCIRCVQIADRNRKKQRKEKIERLLRENDGHMKVEELLHEMFATQLYSLVNEMPNAEKRRYGSNQYSIWLKDSNK